jgi:ABC-type Fe3+/spermidine/putrescine transport system ATPase subunit
VRAEMQRELKRLQHEVGITFAVVTHDQEEAMSMADRIAVMHHGRVQQVAEPVTLYRKPGNVFVADFIGESNLFLGRRVTTGLEVPGLGVLAGQGEVPGHAAAHLMVRPENVRLSRTDGTHGARGLSGTVIDVQFMGGASTIAVDVTGHAPPVLVTVAGTAGVAPGDQVGLDWEASDGVLLAHEEAAAPESVLPA